MNKNICEYLKNKNINYDRVVEFIKDEMKFRGVNNTFGPYDYDTLIYAIGEDNLKNNNLYQTIDRNAYSYIISSQTINNIYNEEQENEYIINNLLEYVLNNVMLKAELTTELEYYIDEVDAVENGVNEYNEQFKANKIDL